MCYNSNCKIEITSRIDGTVNTVSATGKVIRTHSDIRFVYTLDGDDCTLSVCESEVVQIRRGEQNIKMTFRKGEKTDCFLESGGFSGIFSVFTDDLQCTMRDINGKIGTQIFKLLIVYMLGDQKTELNFSAEYKL